MLSLGQVLQTKYVHLDELCRQTLNISKHGNILKNCERFRIAKDIGITYSSISSGDKYLAANISHLTVIALAIASFRTCAYTDKSVDENT